MERLTRLVLLVCLLAFGAACGGEKPMAVAKKIVAAMKSGDKKALESLVTKDSLSFLSKASSVTKFLGGGDPGFGAENISGDTATVDVKVAGVMTPWAFKKEDGKWKYDLKASFDKLLSTGLEAGLKKAFGAGLDKAKDLLRGLAPGGQPAPGAAPPAPAAPTPPAPPAPPAAPPAPAPAPEPGR